MRFKHSLVWMNCIMPRDTGASEMFQSIGKQKYQGLAPVARLPGNPICLKYCGGSYSGNCHLILQLFVTEFTPISTVGQLHIFGSINPRLLANITVKL